MTYEKLAKMDYEERMNIVGRCGSKEMTLREYVEGGWSGTDFNREEDFRFKSGGFIYVAKDDNGEEAAYFVDAANKEAVYQMF
jgi:hypothetical protein